MKKIAFFLLSVTACVSIAQKIEKPYIEVKGEGVILAVPDQIKINLSVESEGLVPSEAKTSNDVAMRKIFNFLKLKNIPENAVKTEYISLDKNRYDKENQKYIARQTFSVILDNIKQYDEILVGMLSQGITNIEGVTFLHKEMAKYREMAQMNAIKNAREKAQKYAEAAGVKVGKVLLISEEIQGYYEGPELYGMQVKIAGKTISGGERSISSKIKMIFEIL